MSSSYQQALEELGAILGIEKLAPDASGLCALAIDNTTVYITDVEPFGEILLAAEIGFLAVPLQPSAAVLLLAANTQVQQTSGAALGVTDLGAVTLSRMVPVEGCNGRQLERTLERFVNAAETWRGNIQNLAHAVQHDRPVAAEPGNEPWIRI
jgi:hypothetical protein